MLNMKCKQTSIVKESVAVSPRVFPCAVTVNVCVPKSCFWGTPLIRPCLESTASQLGMRRPSSLRTWLKKNRMK